MAATHDMVLPGKYVALMLEKGARLSHDQMRSLKTQTKNSMDQADVIAALHVIAAADRASLDNKASSSNRPAVTLATSASQLTPPPEAPPPPDETEVFIEFLDDDEEGMVLSEPCAQGD